MKYFRKKFYLILLTLLLNACVTFQKSDMGYLDRTHELNTGKKTDIQIEIERTLYAHKQNPDNWKLKNNLMVLYRKKGNYEEAIKYGRAILHQDTKNYVALNNLAMVYYDMKNYKYALYLIKKSIDIYDKYPSAHVNLGLIFLKKGESTLAGTEFIKAYRLNRKFYPAIKNLAYYFYNFGNYKKSIPFLKEVLHKDFSVKHKNMLAISYRYIGDYEKAYEIYGEVLRIEPDNEIAIFNTGIIEMEYLDKPSIALKKFKKLKERQRGERYPAQISESKLDEYINKAISLQMIKENS